MTRVGSELAHAKPDLEEFVKAPAQLRFERVQASKMLMDIAAKHGHKR